jgi:hypothetical protein
VVERLAANAQVATVTGSLSASSKTVESEGRQMKQFLKKKKKVVIPLNLIFVCTICVKINAHYLHVGQMLFSDRI